MLRYIGSRLKTTRSLQGLRHKSSLPPSISQLFQNPPPLNSELTINGYVKSVRSLKKVSFVDLSDGSTHTNLMCVLSPAQATGLKTGQSIELKGSWIKSKGNEQPYEFKITPGEESVKIVGNVKDDFPLQKKAHSIQYLRTLPTLRWRTSYLSSILRFRSFVDFKLNEFFNQEGFFKVNPPLITGSDCEGAGELFRVESNSLLESEKKEKFFGKNAFLTVSGQLHLEVLSAALGKVWTLSPTFRAEASDTNRHLSEFWMLEAEVPYVESVDQVTKLTEQMIKHVVKDLANDTNGVGSNIIKSQRSSGGDDVDRGQELEEKWKNLLETEWKSISYKQALVILQESGLQFQHPVRYEDGLATEHEKWLAGEYFKSPVYVTDYPKDMKPFYMKLNSDNETVACFDLLVPEVGEIIGGSLREHDLEKLTKIINERGMKLSELQWYLSLRENSTEPHGGFGLGFERLICYLANVENVRDVVPFPRSKDECAC